ncbi:trans-aconitate 2-methyltransferase [Phenylobacterium sp.]|uniref:class I SAM-dependent methyltransferase n=1 Tax=Phenylobacterium sp. TaxID=1871053 RepID=UPI0025E7431B|nr:class I SAM-dependent methyltransferase [Phenylobacterium sp.]MBX3484343.1 methyltransferase domain-containing protein [Phenylobacterium sp.]MCW5759346.1 methyltransferase domain-containing protein [Phenylobacterium sp.]
MKASEFDKFAEEYLATHKGNIAITGEDPEYFARYKIETVAARLKALGLPAPKRVLDFGCGIGNSAPHLRAAFPDAGIVGLDVSEKSLAVARQRFPGVADFRRYEGGADMPLEPGFDLAFSACVFHHIEAAEHVALFAALKAQLAPGGVLAVFEHNPLNPVSRYIVATCPFDEDAVLIRAGEFARRQRRAGFGRVDVAYTGFFPGPLKALRPLERAMTWLPLGAQYYTLARA